MKVKVNVPYSSPTIIGLLLFNSKGETGLLRWLSGKESTCQAGDVSSIPGLRRYPREGNGNLLQYSCLGNPMDSGAWWTLIPGVTKSPPLSTESLNHHHIPSLAPPTHPAPHSHSALPTPSCHRQQATAWHAWASLSMLTSPLAPTAGATSRSWQQPWLWWGTRL